MGPGLFQSKATRDKVSHYKPHEGQARLPRTA